MNRYNKHILAALIGAMTIIGGASLADARGHGGPDGGPHAGMADISPEMRTMMQKAYEKIAPMQLELRAKRQELTAKIYSGADDKAIQALTNEVNSLQAKVTEARVAMQKEFAKAGVPMHMGRGFGPMNDGPGGCPGMAGEGMMGHKGGHGNAQRNMGRDGAHGGPHHGAMGMGAGASGGNADSVTPNQ